MTTRARLTTSIALLIALGLLAAACGSGEDDAAAASDVPDVSWSGAECLSAREATDALERATYAIVLQYRVGTDDDGDPEFANEFVGTAFAVSDRQLVTNAHVAEIPFEVPGVRVIAVQAGTGVTVPLLSAYIHPDYDGVDSPDVGLFTTQSTLPDTLRLGPVDTTAEARQQVLITGFPGDVAAIYPVEPDEANPPLATAVSGSISALRTFTNRDAVEAGEIDVIQHDTSVTGGNSGSAIFSCNQVIGIHNSGIAYDVFAQASTGELTIERVEGTNSFGVHVRHIHELLDLVGADVLQGVTVQGRGVLDDCPAPDTYLDAVAAATYAVVLEVFAGVDQQGNPQMGYISFGTAFAVDRRVLATNAHVTEGTKNIGVPVVRVLGVQSGTGEVVTLLRALTHPAYTGNPILTPDVGLFTSDSPLPNTLPLASLDQAAIGRGETISVTGFPGDVSDIIPIIPGQTVPQATSLSGTVTALRAHDLTTQVDPANADVIQHQAPTTPGTSGSALIHCGRVVGTNNAGTVQLAVTVNPQTGQTSVDRIAAASNNFAVHVRHIYELLDLFDSQAVQGFELPPPPNQSMAPPGSQQSQARPGSFAGIWEGQSNHPDAQHRFSLSIDEQGNVTGSSAWPATGNFALVGSVDDDGNIRFNDDAAARLGFRTGIYEGRLSADGTGGGAYFEATQEDMRWEWSIRRSG
jgi:S1-C subfamily serine protease